MKDDKRIQIRLKPEVKKRWQNGAKAHKVSVSKLVQLAMTEYIARHNADGSLREGKS